MVVAMAGSANLDARAKPPSHVREVFKQCQKNGCEERTPSDFRLLIETRGGKEMPFCMQQDIRDNCFEEFYKGHEHLEGRLSHAPNEANSEVYECEKIPGLYYFPNLMPHYAQVVLLEKIFKRDLLDPTHQTNVHMHYDVQYPPRPDGLSFYDLDKAASFPPKDSSCHKPLLITQFLEKKLRWMTLGGQYDWTRKVYPTDDPPPFPSDIKGLLEGVFNMRAEAAIVNLYSPGDTLSLHRDVSEFCNRPLISVSIGCECTFVVGLNDENGEETSRVVSMRLRSGDAVVMSGESRFAWHGVPKVHADSCPAWLDNWPGQHHPQWEGWMRRKRINLNVRQMYE